MGLIVSANGFLSVTAMRAEGRCSLTVAMKTVSVVNCKVQGEIV